MRLFIALEIDGETRRELGEEIACLRGQFPRIVWVKPPNLHVTMKFLGEVDENDIPGICDGMDDAAVGTEPFSLEIIGLGCFPDLRRPRVVWAGCGVGGDEAIRLAAEVDKQMAVLQFSREARPHRPHITLGRVRQPAHGRGLETILNDPQNIEFGCVEVSALTLFMSELRKSGPRYTPMYHAELGKII